MAAEYEFYDARRPALKSGDYTLSLEWNVTVDDDPKDGATETTKFHVAGERFSIQPSDVHSVYPPEGSHGMYAGEFAHVILSRDTLPWERSAKAGSDLPWLGLILLRGDEAAACPVTTIPLSKYREHVALTLEPGQADTDTVQVIELPAHIAHEVLPSLWELPMMCHARVTKENGVPRESCAVVVCKRLGMSGRNTLHLVAFENRYPDLADRYLGINYVTKPNQPPCTLISLKSWTFTCEVQASDQTESLGRLFERVNVAFLEVFSKGPRHLTAHQHYGFVAMQHRFRTGETAASWYRGPLSPMLSSFDRSLLELPSPSADALLWFDEDLGALNVTYAAAWELGRLLSMQNQRIFSLLHHWRRQQIHCAHADEAAAHGQSCCHIPQVQCACADAPTAPAELVDWIDGLRKLQGIPYRYLLPHEDLLPPESIRFVAIDSLYMDALLDGALSAVRAPTRCAEQCRAAELALLGMNAPGPITGFLFRSAAVVGWPGLKVTATGDGSAEPLKLYQRLQLSPAIVLYLFRGIATKITIEQTADSVHLTMLNRPDIATFRTSSELAQGMLECPHVLQLSVKW